MAEYMSLDDIYNGQTNKLNSLEAGIELLKLRLNSNAEFQSKNDTIGRIQMKLKLLRSNLTEQKIIYKTQLGLVEKLQSLNDHIDKSSELVEQHFAGKQSEVSVSSQNESCEQSSSYQENAESNVDSYVETPIQPCSYFKPTILEPVRLNLYMEHLTMEEFAMVPKYMLGRHTLNNINGFVDIVNKAVKKKYAILAKPVSSLKNKEYELYQQYKRQEDRCTKGKHFILDSDIAVVQGRKGLDKASYGIITILRHFKRIYLLPSNGLLRYTMVE